MIKLKNFQQLEIQDNEIIDYLRRGKGAKKSKLKSVSDVFQQRINILKKQTNGLLEPQALYEVIDVEKLPFRECFKDAEKIALAVVTIGSKLQEETKKLFDIGNLVDGVILDAIGSAAAETVANLINEEINHEVIKTNLEYSERYSPGYCQWDIKDQELIFNVLPTEKIGVTLTSSFLMSPIKSISFAVNIGKNVSSSRWENRCKYCEIGDCSYRRG